MFQEVVSYVITNGFALKLPKKGYTAEPPAVSHHFSTFLFDLGKIGLPRITHAKFNNEIPILSAICAWITKRMH